ncbi:MAG: ABC transporter family substrate-binding protein [Tessaracoccus sp.]|uniref:ABC transporter substrate-binding protein n=1 Tax=Tessaracoccus sp. TaxID=1971211 RepID=UPI001ED71FE9|nr:ABC transporter substrate-binding protein [Tessaracoccus sp.]MBK7821783.1 ABC transporter family substrate-binding protein [Tessaracoccus sp.]
MKFRRTKAALGLALTGALMLGACTSPEEPGGTTGPSGPATAGPTETTPPGGSSTAPCLQDVGITATKDGDVKFTAGPGDWSGYNSITSKTYSTYNSAVAAHMFSSFVYFGDDGTICDNTEFGTYKILSEDPLEIEYTISDAAVWSDGTPVTINDYLLDYAAQNPEWIVPGYANGKDPKAKAVFDHVSASFPQYIPDGPQGTVDSKTFTVKYDAPYPDFRLVIGSTLPAHVAATKAGLDPKELAQAIIDKDAETVKKVAEFWNTGWMYNPGELPDMADVPSSGPYKLKEGGWQAGNALTLEANDKYWGTPAGTKNLIFRFIKDENQAQALQNGDVQAISPQADEAGLATLQNIGPSINIHQYSTLTWEHLDFNFRDTNVFSDAQGGIKLREAFAYCVPRQRIVDLLIKPVSPDSVVMNAREVFPFQENYQAVVDAAYHGRFDKVDIEQSKALIAESGVKTPIEVRIGYRAGNKRRADQVAAIAASCKDAGFEVKDVNAADFFEKALPDGDYEVALFAWAGSGQIASGENIYATGRPQNYGQYSNATVDAAWKTLGSTLDPAVHLEQVKIIEKELWNTLYGIPLFAHPGIAGSDAKMQNVRPTATQDGISWNAPQWLNS